MNGVVEEYTMKKEPKKENIIKCFVAGLCMLLTGCGTIGLAREASFESAYENVSEEEADMYISESHGVLENVDAEEGTITIYRVKEQDEATYVYDGATVVQDKFGSSLVMTQLLPGEIVTVHYNSDLNKAGSVMISSNAWSYDEVAKYSIDEKRGTLKVGNDTYRISGETKVFSDSEQISLNEILNQDVISLKGTGRDVESIVIDKGHGYLNLEGDIPLIGGWIEVGQEVIQQISQDMLITVPEGNYMVRLSVDGIDETREITIERNKETVLDLSDIEIPEPVNGKVEFSVYPAQADVYVDGIGVNTSYTALLPFGLHQITASAEGYDTVSEYFNVEGEITTVKLTLEESKAEKTVSENTLEEEDAYHTITVQAPAGVEVYQDNLYMGISPVTYNKTTGSHTITLRKTGYVTKSYQIEVEEDDRDLIYSFPDLEEEETDDDRSNSSTVSDNTVSGNKEKKSGDSGGYKKTISDNIITISGNN